ADDEDQRQGERDGLAPLDRPARTRWRRRVSDLLLLLLFLLLLRRALLLLLFLRPRFGDLLFLARDLGHVEVVVGDRDVFVLRLVLLAFRGHRRRGGGLGLAPDFLGLAPAPLFLLRAPLFLLGATRLLFLRAARLLGEAPLFLLGLLLDHAGELRPSACGLGLRLTVGFFLCLLCVAVLARQPLP